MPRLSRRFLDWRTASCPLTRFAASLTSVGALTSSMTSVRSRSGQPRFDWRDRLNPLATTYAQSIAQAQSARRPAMDQKPSRGTTIGLGAITAAIGCYIVLVGVGALPLPGEAH